MRTYREVTIADRQSLNDLVIQEYGSIGELFRLLADNPNITTLDAEPTVGDKLKIQESPGLEDSSVMDAFRKHRIRVANGFADAPGVPGRVAGRPVFAGPVGVAIGNIRLITIV